MVGGRGLGRVLWLYGLVSAGLEVPQEATPIPAQACIAAFCTKGFKKKTNKKTGNKSICVAEALTLYCSVRKRILILRFLWIIF